MANPKQLVPLPQGHEIFCLNCGYCLAGLSTPRCPECGRVFDLQDANTWATAPGNAGRRVSRRQIAVAYVSPYALAFLLALILPANWLAAGLNEPGLGVRSLLGLFSGAALSMIPGLLIFGRLDGLFPMLVCVLVTWTAWLFFACKKLCWMPLIGHFSLGTLWSGIGLYIGVNILVSAQGCD